jgi:formyltetrahydrofolate deformylase
MSSAYPRYILTLSCTDRIGIVAAVSGFLAEQGCNILESAQFFDPSTQQFFLRTVFASEAGQSLAQLQEGFLQVADPFRMTWRIQDADHRPNVLILVSKFGHCLHELLYQQQMGTLSMNVVGIVSNHPDLEPVAAFYKIPYHYLPTTPDTKADQEAQIQEIVQTYDVELVVLARYMQILSDHLSRQLHGRCINIHHSFLPSFKGARPYHQAYKRGVKLIGATAHFVTADLDEGPIIEQETARVTHAHPPKALIEMGRHLESLVLSRAVKYYLERRVLLDGHKTVVFQ